MTDISKMTSEELDTITVINMMAIEEIHKRHDALIAKLNDPSILLDMMDDADQRASAAYEACSDW